MNTIEPVSGVRGCDKSNMLTGDEPGLPVSQLPEPAQRDKNFPRPIIVADADFFSPLVLEFIKKHYTLIAPGDF